MMCVCDKKEKCKKKKKKDLYSKTEKKIYKKIAHYLCILVTIKPIAHNVLNHKFYEKNIFNLAEPEYRHRELSTYVRYDGYTNENFVFLHRRILHVCVFLSQYKYN